MKGDIYTSHRGTRWVDINAGDPGIGQDCKIGARLFTAEDGMDVGDRGAGAAAVVWIIGNGEEADALPQSTPLFDLLVEIGNDRDGEGGRAGADPVFAQLVSMASVDGLHSVAEVVKNAIEGLERPAGATQGFPPLKIILERPKRYERIVGGAAPEDLGTRMTDVRVPW